MISKLWDNSNRNSNMPKNLIILGNNQTSTSPKDLNQSNLKTSSIDKNRPLKRCKDLRKCSSEISETKSTWGITRLDSASMKNTVQVARIPNWMIIAWRQFNSKMFDPVTQLPWERIRTCTMFRGWCLSSILVMELHVRVRQIMVREIDMRSMPALTPASNCRKRKEMISYLIPYLVIQRLSITQLKLITNRQFRARFWPAMVFLKMRSKIRKDSI